MKNWENKFVLIANIVVITSIIIKMKLWELI